MLPAKRQIAVRVFALCGNEIRFSSMFTINKYLPFALLYFFVNAVALPFGLTYMAVLSPVFYGWFVIRKKREPLLPFISILLLFAIPHFYKGVNGQAYLVSAINYISVYLFCCACWLFLQRADDPGRIFRRILAINFAACLLAIPIYFTACREVLWMQHELTDGAASFERLKLLTYEPSYYAMLFTPLFFFFLLEICLNKNKWNGWLLLPMLLLPLLLSFSIGVLFAIGIALAVTLLIHARTLLFRRRVLALTGTLFIGVAVSTILLFLFFPGNVLFLRAKDILSGNDVSGNGRTGDAFYLAHEIIKRKNPLWGVGPGQIKIAGSDIIRDYYLYPLEYSNIAIPNAAAETLAIFGWIGLAIRFGMEALLFFYTRVWTNYYRLALFVFVFVYQFTGSFITNLAEYTIWIIAFSRAFPAFDITLVPNRSSATRKLALP